MSSFLTGQMMTCLATSNHLACTECPLHAYRKQVVPGHGSIKANIMLIGEAPGREEDEQGVPFVGRAGKHLDLLLQQVALNRSQVFLSNICCCRPPDNDLRPYVSSTIMCPDLWLEEEIGLVEPLVVVALGLTAARRWFTGLETAHQIANVVRRLSLDYPSFVVGSYHPSFAIRPGGGKWVDESIIRSLKIARELSDHIY